jgi:hypothetical protein
MIPNWAILSGIEGNLTAYEAVMADLRRHRSPITDLFILGDLIGLSPDNEKLMQRVLNPRSNEPQPQVCQGWWEEQCLTLHLLGRSPEPTALIQRYGKAAVKQLYEAVPRSMMAWLQSLDFGIFELDCLLIHGSTVSVEEELTLETEPIVICDRLARMEANYLFCGRSGLAFQYEIQSGAATDALTTLSGTQPVQTVETAQKFVIGVGTVGRVPRRATYTVYNPGTGQVEFKTVPYGGAQGFHRQR